MQSTTASVSAPPSGSAFAALAIKADTTNYPFESTRPEQELIKGTVAACLNARASERAVIKFIVREHGKETIASGQIQRVLHRPNPVQSRVDFLEECSHFHDATGQAVLFFIRGDGDLPAEVWCLPSFYLVALFDVPSNPVPSAYRWADGRVITEVENLCIIRQNSVKTAPYTGRGYLGDCIDSAILYDYINTAQKNFFMTGGAPNVALVQPVGSILTTAQIADVQAQWRNKYNPTTGISNVAVLPDGVTPHSFGASELDFLKSKDEIRDSIREALQTPKIILGDTDNVNHNNGQTALAMFERFVVLRWGQKMANGIESYLQREYGERFTVELDPTVTAGFTQIPNQADQATVEKEFPFPSQ